MFRAPIWNRAAILLFRIAHVPVFGFAENR